MPARLILNADDFGLTRGINRAIEELHRAGALTSATLMATGEAFDDAVRIAHANPTLGVGCHIVLTDGLPVSHPESIQTLLGADGKHFRPTLSDFVQALLRGRIAPRHIEREALAQLQKLQRAGIDVTHLDTHKHTHLFPQVTAPLLRIAESTSVGAIRNPFEPAWLRPLQHGSLVRRLQVRLLERLRPAFQRQRQLRPGMATVLTTSGSLGVSTTGTLNTETLTQLLNALAAATAGESATASERTTASESAIASESTTQQSSVYELVCHPGYTDSDLDRIPTRLRTSRETERDALLTVLPTFLRQPNAPALIHYGNLGTYGIQRAQGTHTPDTGYEG